jgi:cytidine deaminase
VGTNLQTVTKVLTEVLDVEVSYVAETIHLSRLLDELEGLAQPTPNATTEERYRHYMEVGNDLRKRLNSGSAMADLAITAIREARETLLSTSPPPLRRAFILRSLKRREEVTQLRRVYGPAFLLVAAYAPRHTRVKTLAAQIATSHYQYRERDYRDEAEQLVIRDEREREVPLGQNVEATFPEADIFIDATDDRRMREETARFIRLVFGHPFHTPRRDEQGMYLAKAAALRSAALGRQVGSAITTPEGDVLVVGTNEVPKALGGLYWEGDELDGRDFVQQHDVSDRHKRAVLGDALDRLKKAGWLDELHCHMDVPELVQRALGEVPDSSGAPLRNSRMMDIIEFMRPVHAEMAALMEAARRGLALGGQTLYVTTFPCHECARHIIAAGLARVVYVDPYPKSMAAELYSDSMVVEGTGSEQNRTRFEPFLGIAPQRYLELFEMRGERKNKDGSVVRWAGKRATPKVPGDFGAYFQTEAAVIKLFVQQLADTGISSRA